MKWHIISICTALLLLSSCSKNNSATDTGSETMVQGHLRYYCSCYDGPGLYYVVELSDSLRNLPSFNAADSILLIGDSKGDWLSNLPDSLAKYVDAHTVLSGKLTGKKGCTVGQISGCPLNFKVIDDARFTIIP